MKHYAKWEIWVTKDTLYNSNYMKYLRKANPWTHKMYQWTPRAYGKWKHEDN